jgi:hypothetical protein
MQKEMVNHVLRGLKTFSIEKVLQKKI